MRSFLVVFVLIGSLLAIDGDGNVSSCPTTCFSGACCEVDWNEFRCCPYENGVCCEDGLHCCPQGSQCDIKRGICTYGLGNSPFPMLKFTDVIQPHSAKSPLEKFVICPDRESTCEDSMTCCKMNNDNYGCCHFAKGVCCSDGLHCCPEGLVCDLEHGTCSSTTPDWSTKLLFRILDATNLAPTPRKNKPTAPASTGFDQTFPMAFKSILCPNSSYECPSESTCCLTKPDNWACCPMPKAVCCADGAHCCPNHYTCDLEAKTCVLKQNPNEVKSKLAPLVPSPTRSQPVLCPNHEWLCPPNTTCCQLKDKSWGCCDSPDAVCCSDGLHCCPANSVCDLNVGTCVLPNGKASAPIRHATVTDQVSQNDQICASGNSICRNGTCCKSSTGVESCCPHVDAVCCSDGEHCCPKGHQCNALTGSCTSVVDKNKKSDQLQVHREWFSKRPALERALGQLPQVCPGGDFSCEANTTCCQLADKQWACCPLPNAVCCSDHEHCCPSGTECDVAHQSCLPGLQSEPKAPTPNKLTNLCPDEQSICDDQQTCCTLPDKSWACCPLDHGVCCSDHLHCCPQNTMCLPDSSGCVSQFVDPFHSPNVIQAAKMTSTSSLIQITNDPKLGQNARWCGACGEQGCCLQESSTGDKVPVMCCPHVDGVCCSDGKFCCPPNSQCLPNGQCAMGLDSGLEAFAPYLIPSKSSKSNSWAIPSALKAIPADWDVLLDFIRYRHMRQVHHTVCWDNLHFCRGDEKCCPSKKHGYTCIPDTATCCSNVLDTYCSVSKSCSSDGSSCL